MKLLLIRHGETSGNNEKRFQGRKDYPLTDKGIIQIKHLSEKLSSVPLDAVYTSSLTRAKVTAEEICSLQALEPIENELLNEYSWGVIEGHTREEIKEKYPDLGMQLEENFFETSIPEEEGLMNLKIRVTNFYEKLVDKYKNTSRPTIAVVSHGRVIGGLLVYLTGYSFFHTPWPFTFDNASITEVVYWEEYDKGRIIRLNETCHLL